MEKVLLNDILHMSGSNLDKGFRFITISDQTSITEVLNITNLDILLQSDIKYAVLFDINAAFIQ